ncbi:hypothetical protein [Pseudoalteromonas luteoviolacea]|nr:hypothetical protein [Pseudoalteromonas luteoviolacea]
MSTMLNENSIYGLGLGESYDNALKVIGRFSFDWQVNDIWRLVTVGRNTALFFKQDILVGAQYHRQLLPKVWSNLIELAASKPSLKVDGNSLNIVNQAISASHLAVLEQQYSMLDYDTYRISEDESELRIAGLVIGKLPTQADLIASLPCYDEYTPVQDFINEYSDGLPKLYGQTGKTGFLTGCGQIIQVRNDNRFISLVLTEQANFTNAYLIHSHKFSDLFSGWAFYGVGYLEQVKPNNGFKIINAKDGIYEVQAGKWFGHFTTDEGLAYEGTFHFQ